MRRVLSIASVIAMLVAVSVVGAEAPRTWRDSRGGVTVIVTLLPPAADAPLKAKVVLETHSVDLDTIAFERAVVLRTAQGAEVAPAAVEQASGAGHHREAIVAFGAAPIAGARIVVKDVAGIPERVFALGGGER